MKLKFVLRFWGLLALAFLGLQAAHGEPELIRNGAFGNGTNGWQLETPENIGATVVNKTNDDGSTVVCITVPVKANHGYDVQFVQSVFNIPSGVPLRLTFRARGDAPIAVALRLPKSPWTVLWHESLPLDHEWKDFTYEVTLPPDATSIRLDFTDLGTEAGEYCLGDVSLKVAD
ncbi:hypothetical protein BH09VER1_BH09VER1_14030 [soil metagenome]